MPAMFGIATVGVLAPMIGCTIHAFFFADRETAMGGAFLSAAWLALTGLLLAAYGGI